jgi:hypothetical protein
LDPCFDLVFGLVWFGLDLGRRGGGLEELEDWGDWRSCVSLVRWWDVRIERARE